MSKAKAVCPQCGQDDCLSVDVNVPYELNWRNGGYEVGAKLSDFWVPDRPDGDSHCTCGNCGWEGEFRELKKVQHKYQIILELNLEDEAPNDGVLEQIRSNLRLNRPLWNLAFNESIEAISAAHVGTNT